MHLWKTAATKLRAVKGMRGFRDKIKGTKTKLLRRDSKDSTEEASAIRPAKSAKGASGEDAASGSWGRKSKRQSLLGKEASRSDNSLTANSERTVDDTNEPRTPREVSSANENGEIVIEGGTAPKRRRSGGGGGGEEEDECHQPQSSPLAKPPLPPDADPTLYALPPAGTTTTPPTEQNINLSEARRDIPLVLIQKDSADSKAAIVGEEGQPSKLPQNPLTENETLPPPPLQSQPPHSQPSPTPPDERVIDPLPSRSASLRLSNSDKSTSSDSTVTRSNSRPNRRSSDLNINTTNLPITGRPYHLAQAQFPTDSSGIRTDTDTSSLNALRRSSSRTSISANESLDVVPNEKRDSTLSTGSQDQDSLVYSSTPPPPLAPQPIEPAAPAPPAPEPAQPLNTVSETGVFNTNELGRNESFKYSKPLITPSNSRRKPNLSFSRRQSLIHASDSGLLHSLLEQESASPTYGKDSLSNIQLIPVPMPQNEHHIRTRKVWVKRAGGSPTQVLIAEDDFVDAVRDLCLRKYANGLGRQFDSPDLIIKVFPSAKPQSARRQVGNTQPHVERQLLPDEIVCQVLDDYFPSGQSSEDALVVDVPQQQRSRTPRPSPGPHSMSYAYGQNMHDLQLPGEDYFTPVGIIPSLPHSQSGTVRSAHPIPANPTSLSNYMANSPPPASPGHRTIKRPGPVRMATSSPVGSTTSSVQGTQGGVMLMPRGGGGGPERSRSNQEVPQSPAVQPQMVALPSSPGLVKPAPEKPESPGAIAHAPSPDSALKSPPPKSKETIPASIGTLDGQVPAINVLIVEDNIINLKLLEAFMKRLKVRWATAMNGRDAVNKWRTGGFQLVLMDIQLPIMNGLDATKEIRRLERLNGIGSFSSGPSDTEETLSGADKLDKSLVFKGSVIIVALTASSLQSDRHEALAVGCNDFLTKPVNFTFLERKVMEWGCMQALIDFEGWRKWKDLASKANSGAGKTFKGTRTRSNAKNKALQESSPTPPPTQPPPAQS